MAPQRTDPRVRFMSKVDMAGDSECWNWTAAKDKGGYGRFRSDPEGPTGWAHQFMYLWSGRTIPEGMQVDHLCRNPSCVNPRHLEAVTEAENHKRRQRMFCKRDHLVQGDNAYWHRQKRHFECRECRRLTAAARYAQKGTH